MRACPRCGTENVDGAAACAACGGVLAPLVARPAPNLKQTMLGLSPNAPVAPRAPAPAPAPPAQAASVVPSSSDIRLGLAGTMLGMQSPFGAPPTAPPTPAAPEPPPPITAGPPAAGSLKRTMLGFAAPAAGAAPADQGPQTAPNFTPAPMVAQRLGLGGTLIHEPPPGTPSPPDLPTDAAPETASAPPPVPPKVQHAQTMLGVARPGIAPLRPGKSSDPPPRPSPVAAPPRPMAPPPAPPAPAIAAPPKPQKRGGRGALVLIIVAALLAITAGIVAFLWESPRPMRAEVTLDDRGNEALTLTCDDCVDGTVVSIGTSRATIKAKKAELPVARPLEIGNNKQIVSVRRPGIGRDEEVVLAVPIDYRVRGVLTSLSEDPPKLKVAVQTTPGSAAVVDGKPVPLDASGKGEHVVDVSKDLEGPADAILPFEKKLPYVITPSGGTPKNGDVTLRFGIVPLRIDAPGDSIIVETETFMLGGRTLKEGRVTVGGRPITVDAEGRFAQLMNVSSVGETTIVVRAESKDHAPRLVRVRVKRVKSLRDEATTFRQSAVSDYVTLAADPKKGEKVALEGEIVEVRLDGEVTVLLLDVKKGCGQATCFARVLYGGRFDTKKGASVGAYGVANGSVDGPRSGVKVPEIHAEFLLPLKTKP